MKIVFISTHFNHHQKPVSENLYSRFGDNYTFIEVNGMREERKALGWEMESIPSYVVSKQELEANMQKYIAIINSADIVIVGGAYEHLIKQRKKLGKIIIRGAERPVKEKQPLKYFPRFLKWNLQNPRRKPIYMLCCSAYTASDYAKYGLFKKRSFKWGYFPECKHYDNVESLISNKKKNSILWCGRFIDWKHPEYAIELAQRLKNDGYDFELNMIGNGQMLEKITQMVKDLSLEENVHILGSMKPEEVRTHMEQSEIYILTSNRQEGWGAVLNESMNSACAVVANNAIGAAPYLINNGENGYLYYNDKNSNELYEKVKLLLDDSQKRVELSKKAYETIVNEWNAESATERLLNLFEKLLNKEDCQNLYKDGPCSKA